LERIRKKHRHMFPTVRKFAEALEIAPSHLSRAMGAGGQPFDVRGCLRLAKVTGENAGMILRAAGKGDIATLIEDLYGVAHLSLTPMQQKLLAAFDAIQSPDVRNAFLTLVESASGGTGGSSSAVGGAGGGGMLPPPKDPDHLMRPPLDILAARRARTR
jgi:hypothetical protein